MGVGALLCAWALLAGTLAQTSDGAATPVPACPGVSHPAQGAVCGTVTVNFHGDPAAGCAAAGLCDVSGTVTWSTATTGDAIVGATRGGKVSGELIGDSGQDSYSATVVRTAADGSQHTCSQSSSTGSTLVTIGGTRERTVVALASLGDRDPLAGRCAGPREADVAAALPSASTTIAALQAQGSLKLGGSATQFSGDGFSGTVTSTVTFAHSRMLVYADDGSSGPSVGEPVAFYRVTVRGQLNAQIAGPTSGCEALDACGLSESVTVAPGRQLSDGAFAGPLPTQRHGETELHALDRAGSLDGALFLVAQGSATSTQPGAAQCTGSAGESVSTVAFGFHRNRVYLELAGTGSGDLFRTHCPGPFASDFGVLATGTLTHRGSRSFTLHFNRGAHETSADGYTLSTQPDLTITLRFTHIAPSGFD